LSFISKVVQGTGCVVALMLASGCPEAVSKEAPRSASSSAQLSDGSDGKNWPGPGRTFGEQHFSPLGEINADNVSKLGLVWSMDLPTGNSVTQPLEVDGVLYFSTGYSVIHAVESASGKELWSYDPKASQAAGKKLRLAWGSRGIAWWNGKIYTGTLDGRLIAIDAATGKPVWSVMTVDKDDGRYITGAPRVFDGKVIVGHGGADVAATRGYVTTYDGETGKQLWRFYVVPGNPADGFENKAMEMAAKTWFGEWWKYGGGGTVWNAMSYDPETDTVFLGTGNGAPWNRKIRSQGKGDNLFLASIVALDGNTGAYKWHYQINPGESWDYNANMDMEFADLSIHGKPRQVLITAPKNGFLYVIDRRSGQLISAEPYVKVTWATGIDLKTGRPIDAPNSRYETGPFLLAPGPVGAHSWLPMAFSRTTGLVYIPTLDQDALYSDSGFPLKDWQRPPGFGFNGGVGVDMGNDEASAALVAWNPVTQKQAWRIPMPAIVSGGVVATSGNLVFQGSIDGGFNAYDASNGKRLWTFDAKAPVMAPPISYSVNGRQYVTVLSGAGTSLVLLGGYLEKYGISYRDQKRRVLTFALGGSAVLPDTPPYHFVATADADYHSDPAAARRGEAVYGGTCLMCHGRSGYAAGNAPDLRASPVITSDEAFEAIVADGTLVAHGMPRFDDMSKQTREDIRQYVRSLADAARQAGAARRDERERRGAAGQSGG
jgi:quinohemoprotein ethanol dehydrogenase